MRTNIEIDDKLMRNAMELSGAKTKKAAVEAGLALLVKSREQAGIAKWFGKVEFYDDHDHQAMRVSDKWNGSPLTWETEAALPRPEGSQIRRSIQKRAA
jgi:Arc/MetJ family transcription regulator